MLSFAMTCLLLSGPILAASPVPPGVKVRVTCPVDLAFPGMRVPFKAVVQGAPTGLCQWTVSEAGIAPEFAESEAMRHNQAEWQVPVITGFKIFTVRATSVHDDKAFGEASILAWGGPLMISGIPQLIDGYARPQGWATPCSIGAEPFLDLETGKRFQAHPGTLVTNDFAQAPRLPEQMVGCNRPVALALPGFEGKDARCLLSLRHADGSWERLSGTATQPPVLQALGRYQAGILETLSHHPMPSRADSFTRGLFREVHVHVRGMVPLAGNPALDPGDADGRGLGARFREPGGPAILTDAKTRSAICVVPDAEGQVLRLVAEDGQALTLCGKAGEAGFQDGAGAKARFNRPTYVATCPVGARPDGWEFAGPVVVADSANHAIRRVDLQGKVTTLAGNGKPGYVDSDLAAQATFNDPQGVAVDPKGNVYVADRGNHVIRKITPDGQVITLAGSGKPGTADGEGLLASFTDLKGLTLRHPHDGRLFVVDGHAVREVSPRGRVTTLLGKVLEAGYAAFPFSEGTLRWPLTQVACLNQPQGISSKDGQIYIADTGNHALRCLFGRATDPIRQIPIGHLLDLAGHPDDPVHRWGLLQDGLPWLRTPDYASLSTPRGITFNGSGDALLTTGPCVAILSRLNHTRVQPILAMPPILGGPHLFSRTLRCVSAKAGHAFAVNPPLWSLTNRYDAPCGFDWSVELVDPATQKALAEPICGRNHGRSAQIPLPAREAGLVELRVKCLLDDGVTEFFRYHATIEPL